MTWEIFLGIVALIGFLAAVCGPLIKLNTNIVRLNDSIQVLQNAMDKIDTDNEKSHKRIWEHNEEQDDQIDNHEHRINSLEHNWDVATRMHPNLMQMNNQSGNDID